MGGGATGRRVGGLPIKSLQLRNRVGWSDRNQIPSPTNSATDVLLESAPRPLDRTLTNWKTSANATYVRERELSPRRSTYKIPSIKGTHGHKNTLHIGGY
mgnify:FL=1